MNQVFYNIYDTGDFYFKNYHNHFFKGLIYFSDLNTPGKIIIQNQIETIYSEESKYIIFLPQNIGSTMYPLINTFKFFYRTSKFKNLKFKLYKIDSKKTNFTDFIIKQQNILKNLSTKKKITIIDFMLHKFLRHKTEKTILQAIEKIQNQYNFNYITFLPKTINLEIHKNSFFDFIITSKFTFVKSKQRTRLSLNYQNCDFNKLIKIIPYISSYPKILDQELFYVLLDDNGNTLLANNYTLQKLDVNLDEIYGKSWIDLFVFDEDKEKLFTVFEETLVKNKTYQNFKNRLKTKHNKKLFMEWLNSSIFDEFGNQLGTQSLGIDRSQEKKFLNHVTTTLSNYEFLMSYFKIIFFSLHYNLKSKKLDISFLDSTQNIFPKNFHPLLHNDYYEDIIAKNLDLKNKKTQFIPFELKIDNKKINALCSLIYLKETNDTIFYSGLINNQTEEKEKEEKLSLLNKAVNNLFEYFVITDIHGTILYINDTFSKITQYTREEALGQNPKILQSGKHTRTFYKNLWDTILSGKTWHGKFINKKKNGGLYNEEATISPIFNSKNTITHFVAIKKDITKEVKLQENVTQYKKIALIGQFTSGLVHDMNNILTAIKGNVTLLKLKDGNSEEINDIESSVSEAKNLIANLLSFAKNKKIEYKPLNLNNYITNLKSMAHGLIKSRIQIEFIVDENLWTLHSDEAQLTEILLNLISNARDAIPEHGIIEISIQNYEQIEYDFIPEQKYILFTIKDNGKGMTEKTKEHIFEPFFTTKKKDFEKGTGLGLANVSSIIRQANGYIFIDSEPNKGTTFTIYLPIEQREKQ